jgi:uncharacterized protein
MLVALERFDLRIPRCRSLKEKRHVVRSLIGALRSRFEVSVAEVDHLDLWQRTAIGVAVVGAEAHNVRRVMHSIETFIEAWGGVEIIDSALTLHDPEG